MPPGSSEPEIHAAARAGRFTAPRQHNKWIPEELEEALVQAMHRGPDQRFDSCAQFAEELEELSAVFEKPATAETLRGFLVRIEGTGARA